MADLLVSDLSQSRYLNVLSKDKVFLVLRDLGQVDVENDSSIDLTEVAARAKVENIVIGTFIRAGQRFRISATVRNISTGDSVVLPGVEARNEDDIFLRIDELSTKIKNHLVSPVEIAGRDLDLDLGKITTSSLEAYRHFVDGRSSWKNGRAIDAMESFEKAVAIDPEFAMAYNWLAGCYSSLPGYEDKAEESRTRSFEFSDHASPRERFYIRGQYYMYQGQRSWDQAIEAFSELVRVYPDDELGVLRLGYLFRLIEQWERCIETLESIVDGQVFTSHIVYLSRAYCALGQYEEALEVSKGVGSDHDPLQYRHQLAINLIFERRYDAALLEADKMLKRSPGYVYALMVKGDVHFYRSEWDQAEVYYRELLTPVSSENNRLRVRFDGIRRLAGLYLAKGQSERALDCMNQAIHEATALGERRWLLVFHLKKALILLTQGNLLETDAEVEIALAEAERRNLVTGALSAHEIRGLMNLEAGEIREAKRAADQMKTEIEGWLNPKLVRRWHYLAGHIQIAEKDVGRAVAHFEEAVALLPYQHEPNGDAHAWYYSSLAYAYYLSGELEKAQEWYEKTHALTSGRLVSGEIYAKSHFMLGQIYEQRGMHAEAIRSYRTFLDLWREADSKTPEIEEAKRSLAALLD